MYLKTLKTIKKIQKYFLKRKKQITYQYEVGIYACYLSYVWSCSCAMCCMLVELCWKTKENEKSFYPLLLKSLRPLLRVSTDHLYSLGNKQCRFILDNWRFIALVQLRPREKCLRNKLYFKKMLCLVSVPRLKKKEVCLTV